MVSDIYNAITKIPNGRFFRIIYKTEMPLKCEYKKTGIEVYKITSRIARTGINYANIKKQPIAMNHKE